MWVHFMIVQIALASLMALSAMVSTAWSQEAGNSDDVEKGRHLADLICANCHVVAPDQTLQPVLRPPAPSFESIARRSTTNADAIRTFLASTHRDISKPDGMPNPQLLDYQLNEVVSYLLSLQKPSAVGVNPSTEVGSCRAEIARVELVLRQARANRSAPESLNARLHRQPTPSTINRAEAGAQQEIETSLALARKLESEGKDAECMVVIKKISLPASVGQASPSGFKASKRTAAVAASDVRRLMRLMDKDHNGSVSRDEFMQFMSRAFDRFDTNKSGALESSEVSNSSFPVSIRTKAASEADVQQLLRMMDADKNGTVTKDEFLQFMSQTFSRLDADKNERLDRQELRRLSDPQFLLCHDLGVC